MWGHGLFAPSRDVPHYKSKFQSWLMSHSYILHTGQFFGAYWMFFLAYQMFFVTYRKFFAAGQLLHDNNNGYIL